MTLIPTSILSPPTLRSTKLFSRMDTQECGLFNTIIELETDKNRYSIESRKFTKEFFSLNFLSIFFSF